MMLAISLAVAEELSLIVKYGIYDTFLKIVPATEDKLILIF